MEEGPPGLGYLLDGQVERILVDFRRGVEPAELADELQRGGADFFIRGRRVEVEEGLDVSADGSPDFRRARGKKGQRYALAELERAFSPCKSLGTH